MWSIGCIFGELLTKCPLLQGKNEVDELSKVSQISSAALHCRGWKESDTSLCPIIDVRQIFELCGIPTEESWPGFKRLPNARSLRLPTHTKTAQGSIIRSRFPTLTNNGAKLLNSLLSLNPTNRPTAKEMLEHEYFREDPRPKPTAMFPTFPSKAGQEKRRRQATPAAPLRGGAAPALGEVDYSSIFKGREEEEKGGGFRLKLV
jgi:cell division cycle 2-like protein